MIRTIPIEIKDEYVIGDHVAVGAAGSWNDVILAIKFSPFWEGLSKQITWRNAYGENTGTLTIMGTDLLAPGEKDLYLVPIPKEPKEHSGEMSMTIRGIAIEQEKAVRGTLNATAYFNVLESEFDMNGSQEGDINPSQAEQLQAQLDAIKGDIVNAGLSATKAESYAVGGTGSREGEDTDNAKYYKEESTKRAAEAVASANSASTDAKSANFSKESAKVSANLSESYAVGGTGTRPGENTDNSKYYYTEFAKDLADANFFPSPKKTVTGTGVYITDAVTQPHNAVVKTSPSATLYAGGENIWDDKTSYEVINGGQYKYHEIAKEIPHNLYFSCYVDLPSDFASDTENIAVKIQARDKTDTWIYIVGSREATSGRRYKEITASPTNPIVKIEFYRLRTWTGGSVNVYDFQLSDEEYTEGIAAENGIGKVVMANPAYITNSLNAPMEVTYTRELTAQDLNAVDVPTFNAYKKENAEALKGKVDVEAGKGLSDENFTKAEKAKLAGLKNYTLPTPTEAVLGGIKAPLVKGDEDAVARFDPSTGYLKLKSGGGGGVAGVTFFNGRQGDVKPQTGDYTAEMVGAAAINDKKPSTTEAYSSQHIEDIIALPQYNNMAVIVSKEGIGLKASHTAGEILNQRNGGGTVVLYYTDETYGDLSYQLISIKNSVALFRSVYNDSGIFKQVDVTIDNASNVTVNRTNAKEYADKAQTETDITKLKTSKSNAAKFFDATIPASGWSGSSAPYTNRVSVPGMVDDGLPIAWQRTETEAQSEAFALLGSKITTETGFCTFTAKEKPSVNIDVTIGVTGSLK